MKKLLACGVAVFLLTGCLGKLVSEANAQATCTTETEIMVKVHRMYKSTFNVVPSFTRMDHDISILFDKVYSADKNVPAETDLKEILVFSDGAGHAFLVWMNSHNCATVTSRITDAALARYMTLGDV